MLAFNRPPGRFNSVSLAVDGMVLPTQPIAETLDRLDWRSDDIHYHTEINVPAEAQGVLYVSYAQGASQAP